MMTSPAKVPRPPCPLGKDGKRLWRVVHQNFEMDAHEVEILARACRTADVIAALDAVVAEDGPTSVGSTGQVVVHPAAQEARLQTALFAKLLGQLGLPDPEGGSTVKTGHQARSALGHKQRWAPNRVP